jgi:hypothetical protein
LAEDRIREIPAHTLAGLAIKARLVFYDRALAAGDPGVEAALAYGKPVTDDMVDSPEAALAWSVVELADKLAGERA